MLAAVLKKESLPDLRTEILNLFLEQSPSECAEMILKHAPDCVGFSMYVWNRQLSLQTAAILKQKKPDIVILAGGPEVSADHEGILKESCIDTLLPGESEGIIIPAMRHLLEGGDPEGIADIISPSPVKDLASLPSPFIDETLKPSDYSGMLWELSRGCPFKCDFCYESRGAAGVRRFPMDRIRTELQLFKDSGVEQIFVLDPTFNYDKETAKEILRLISEIAPDIRFFFEVRSEFLDEEMAELFAAIDCSLQIGMQSAHNEVLKNINRTMDPEDFTSSILLLHEVDVCYGFDLIFGLPGDTFSGFCASLDFAMDHVPNHIDIFPLAVLPGTRLHEHASSLGLEHQTDAPYQVLSSPKCDSDAMRRAKELADAFDLFYNRGAAVPWFGMVTDVLDLTPSTFFKKFADWLGTRSTEDIVALQGEFIADLFAAQGDDELSLLARDIIRYFAYSGPLAEEELALSFDYSPIELLELLNQGVTGLRELHAKLPKKKCKVAIDQESLRLL
jgi:radical SAM superfamily enzyme YgiQ (UPF0313 family)